jgi:hypothetical protein
MENQPSSSARPTFLTVVCIISFVGLGISILKSISALILSSVGSAFYSMIQDGLEKGLQEAAANDPGSAVFLEHIFDAVLKLIGVLPVFSGIILLCSIIALVGVFMMWSLKKIGFYLYAGAKVIMVLLPILLIGYNFLSVLITLGIFFGAAIFITLYGLNLKAMK